MGNLSGIDLVSCVSTTIQQSRLGPDMVYILRLRRCSDAAVQPGAKTMWSPPCVYGNAVEQLGASRGLRTVLAEMQRRSGPAWGRMWSTYCDCGNAVEQSGAKSGLHAVLAERTRCSGAAWSQRWPTYCTCSNAVEQFGARCVLHAVLDAA